MISLIVPIALALYAATLIWLAANDAQSAKGFMNAKRSVGVFATMASVAGNLRDGAGLAAWVLLGIYYGFGALWLTLGLCTGLGIIAFVGPYVRQQAAERDYLTLQQLLRDHIGSRFARASNWIVAITALLYAAAQVYVAGHLFSSALGAPSWMGIAATCVIVGLYLYMGGYYTTIRTGVVQWCIIMVIVVIPWIIGKGHNIHIPFASFSSPGLVTAASFFILSMVVVISSADLWQLVFTAKTPNAARNGMILTMPIYISICIGLVYFAKSIQAVLPPGSNPGTALFDLFTSGVLPQWVSATVALFIIAAIMSTLDSQVFLFTSTIVEETLPLGITTQDPLMEKASRRVLVITFIILGLIASTIGNIIEFLFSAVTLGTVLVPAILITTLTWTRNKVMTKHFDNGMFASVLLATGIYIILFLTGLFKNMSMTLVPVCVSALGTLATLWICRVDNRLTKNI